MAEIHYFCKQLKVVIIIRHDFFNIIIIVIILHILYNNFEITIASMLKTRDKTIEEIQSIIQSKQTKYKAKQSIYQLKDKAIAVAMVLY